MRYRLRLPFLLAALAVGVALLAAGCHGGPAGKPKGGAGQAESAAAIAPPDAPLFVTVNTDLDSDQWQSAQELLKKFPGRGALLDLLRGELAEEDVDFERDVRPALGPELDVVLLGFEDPGSAVVVLTQPKDEAAFTALLRKGEEPPVVRKIAGWTALAQSAETLDRFERARAEGSLADSERFTDAMASQPPEAIARVFVDGPSVLDAVGQQVGERLGALLPGRAEKRDVTASAGRLEWIAGSLTADDEGAVLELRTATDRTLGEAYSADLPEQIPAGALAVLSFNGVAGSLQDVRRNPAFEEPLAGLERALGVPFDDVIALFGGEGALYVREASPIPEVTLVLETGDEERAQATLDRLGAKLAKDVLHNPIQQVDVAGVPVKMIPLGDFAVYYGVFDGKVVITDVRAGIAGLREAGPRLADDPAFQAAKDAASMPDETTGFLYVNASRSLRVLQDFAQTAGEKLPEALVENLEPVESLLVYAAGEGGETVFKAFVRVPS